MRQWKGPVQTRQQLFTAIRQQRLRRRQQRLRRKRENKRKMEAK